MTWPRQGSDGPLPPGDSSDPGGSGPDSPSVPDPDEGAPVRWGLGDAVWGFVVGLALTNTAFLVWAVANGRLEPDADLTPPIGASALIQAALWLGLAGVPVVASRLKGRGRLADDFGFRAAWPDIPIGAAAGLVTQIVAIPLIYLPLTLLADDLDLGAPARELTDQAASTADYVILFLVIVIGAPIAEELFYRGLVLRSLIRRGMRAAPAIAVTSVVFGMSHFQVLQFPALVVIGAVLGTLTHRYQRLGPAIFGHIAFNATAYFALVLG